MAAVMKIPLSGLAACCDIRRSRSATSRAELAAKLHTLYGGLSDDWVEGEPDKFDSGKATSTPA